MGRRDEHGCKEEGLDAPKLTQQIGLLILYVDDVVIFSLDVAVMQYLLGAFKAFCQNSGLTLNMIKQILW